MGGISKREGMCVYISLIHFIVQQKLTQFCKAIVLLFSRKVKPNTFGTPWTSAHQPPLSMGFPRQEYWSGLPFPSPGNLPNSGIEPASPALQMEATIPQKKKKKIAINC